MSLMPVVWCSDPNSNSKKPTAFALHGIQLQGNLSEQHVLAVRELISAASEGRLLLPTDGGIVLLDCGVGVGSVIIQDREQEQKPKNEIAQQEMFRNSTIEVKPFSHTTKSDVLYEFLCCARCMGEGVKLCHRNTHSSKFVEKFLDAKINAGRANKRPGNMRPTNGRRKSTVSFKSSRKRSSRRNQASANGHNMPIYATVNKQLKHKKPQIAPDLIATASNDVMEPTNNLSSTARKTSFDSTCTVSSMDSGFMEMQNKLESAKNAAQCDVQIKIEASEGADMVDSSEILPNTWSRLTIPSQSRNRRKSYEEFKLLFSDVQKNSSMSDANRLEVENNCVKSRRKSHEEFKASGKCDSNSKLICDDIIVRNDLSPDDSSLFKMKRKNSKRVSSHKIKLNNKTINQGLLLNKTTNMTDADQSKNNYDKNLELFKSHCSKNNIRDFDNLLSCGTIYDIIQRKSDIYTKNFKRYDKYMTYGTLYEILHRKSDECEPFERKRTISEKYSNRRINYAHIDFKVPAENHNCSTALDTATDTSGENLNSTSTTTGSLKQGSANNQLSITSLSSQQPSTIYDILQTKKLETVSPKQRNRFLVRKITEEDLIESRKSADNDVVEKAAVTSDADCIPPPRPAVEAKKPNRIRRFSNILSYAPKESDKAPLKVPMSAPDVGEKKSNVHLEAKIDELYSRLNRITKQNESQSLSKDECENEPNKIYKSSSLDMLSALNETDNLIGKQKPFRKISVPTHQSIKPLPKKSTRRLSEFSRGEFLNEKL